jgi:hypothetical protein
LAKKALIVMMVRMVEVVVALVVVKHFEKFLMNLKI